MNTKKLSPTPSWFALLLQLSNTGCIGCIYVYERCAFLEHIVSFCLQMTLHCSFWQLQTCIEVQKQNAQEVSCRTRTSEQEHGFDHRFIDNGVSRHAFRIKLISSTFFDRILFSPRALMGSPKKHAYMRAILSEQVVRACFKCDPLGVAKQTSASQLSVSDFDAKRTDAHRKLYYTNDTFLHDARTGKYRFSSLV